MFKSERSSFIQVWSQVLYFCNKPRV